jgi:prepilin-type N-terminal cleavage/methylation domain-containing protein
MKTHAIKRNRGGFTLIELLAVITILAILSVLLLTNLTDVFRNQERQNTKVLMKSIEVGLGEYSDAQGDVPRSSFTSEQGTPPNTTNLGAECLYLALCGEKGPAFGKFDDKLVNTDEDQVPKSFPGFQVPTLWEIGDPWGNPIAYFHHRDYTREDPYVTIDKDAQRIDNVVRALKNPKTGTYYNPTGAQMFSAGPDGKFGTDDDVMSFEK